MASVAGTRGEGSRLDCGPLSLVYPFFPCPRKGHEGNTAFVERQLPGPLSQSSSASSGWTQCNCRFGDDDANRVSASGKSAIELVYIAFLTVTTAITAAGFALLVLVMRRIVDYRGIDVIGAWVLVAVIALILSFIVSRGLAREAGRPTALVERRARTVLIGLGIAGVALALAAPYFQDFGGVGPWREGRVVAEGEGEFWLYFAGERTPATALDFDMEMRTIQLVPLGVAVSAAGVFQAYVSIDRVAPGVIGNVVFAPWRLERRGKPDVHEELDAYSRWD